MKALIYIALALALSGCSRAEFLSRVENVQNGAHGIYLAEQQERQAQAWSGRTEVETIVRRPPEPERGEAPKAEAGTPTPPQQTYIYIMPTR